MAASYVAGPALAGALVQVLTAPVAVAADAVSFLASAVLVGTIPVDEPPPPAADAAAPTLPRRAGQGLAFVVRHPILRASLGCATTVNFFALMAGGGLTVLFAGRVLELSAGVIGLAFGAGATGALLGTAMAPMISRRIGVGRSIAVGSVLFPAPLAIAAAASGPVWVRFGGLGGAEFLSGAGVMLFDINLNSLHAAVIPDGMRSRVAGAYNTVNYGIRPVGALVGGLVATLIGLRATLLTAAVGERCPCCGCYPPRFRASVRSLRTDRRSRTVVDGRLVHGEAAVDEDRLAGDVRRGGAGEEDGRAGEVVRLAVAADQGAGRHRGVAFGGNVGDQGCDHESGYQRVAAHAAWGPGLGL